MNLYQDVSSSFFSGRMPVTTEVAARDSLVASSSQTNGRTIQAIPKPKCTPLHVLTDEIGIYQQKVEKHIGERTFCLLTESKIDNQSAYELYRHSDKIYSLLAEKRDISVPESTQTLRFLCLSLQTQPRITDYVVSVIMTAIYECFYIFTQCLFTQCPSPDPCEAFCQNALESFEYCHVNFITTIINHPSHHKDFLTLILEHLSGNKIGPPGERTTHIKILVTVQHPSHKSGIF